MKSFEPFIVKHIHLEDLKSTDQEFSDHQRYYIVIWWQRIALGHLFFEPNSLSRDEIDQKIIDAILPTLSFYGNKNQNIPTLAQVVEVCSILFHPENIPDQCSVSVVICTKDRPEYLQKCLASFNEQRCKPAEIIVIDNAPTDERTKAVVQNFPSVKYYLEERKGLDIARNTGAKKASQEIIAYTDDDTTLHRLWVYHVYKTFNDPKVDAMTGLILAQEINTQAQWIFEKFWPFNRGFIDKDYNQAFFRDAETKVPPVWEIGAGANMAFRKSVFESVGYFDERLDVGAAGCNGDSEIWYRILANGSTIHYNPRAIVSHKHRESMEGLKHQIFYYMRGFTAAVLFQHKQFQHKGNVNHLLKVLPKYYLRMLYYGFPRYSNRYATVFDEVRGVVSGLVFYLRKRHHPSNIK